MRRQDREDWGVAEAAALWVVRLREPGAERYIAEFRRWCDESKEHEVEFQLARAMDFQLDGLRSLSPSLQRILAAPQQRRSAKVIQLRAVQSPPPPPDPVPLDSVAIWSSASSPGENRPGTDRRSASPSLESPSAPGFSSTSLSATGLSEASLSGAGLSAGRHSAAGPSWGSRFASWMAAAAALAVVALGAGWHFGLIAGSEEFETAIGERRSVVLEDGSSFTLNTASRVAVRFSSDERAIDLIEGEALFEVAKDNRRPFRVYSADAVIEDVSTRFNVRQRSGSTEVTVTDGRVRVLPNRQRNGSAPDFDVTELEVGDEAIISGGLDRPALLIKHLSAAELDRKVAWKEGYLVFVATPLTEAVFEVNRYNKRKIQIDDPRIAELQIGGRFEATGPSEFATALSLTFPIQVVEPARSQRPGQPIRLIGAAE
jgi:ferric-dicitrate binding protein FerR (iron transport regulator)